MIKKDEEIVEKKEDNSKLNVVDSKITNSDLVKKTGQLSDIEKTKDFISSIAKKDKVSLTFKGNRKFDLHIGRYIVQFTSREKKEIPSAWLSHRDFENVSKYFIKG